MRSKPVLATFIFLVLAVGAGLLAYTLPALPSEALPMVVLLALLCAGAQYLPVSLFVSSSVSVALAFAWLALTLYGPAAAILVNVPSIFVHALYPKRRPAHKVVFNLGLTACAAGGAGLVYQTVGGEVPVASYQAGIIPLALAVLTYYVIDCGGVALAVSISEDSPLRAVWRRTYMGLLPHYLAVGGVSLGMALAYQMMGVAGMLFFSLPLVMAWQAFKAYSQKSAEVQDRDRELSEIELLLDKVVHSTVAQVARPDSQPKQTQWDPSQMELAMEYAAETARRLGLDAQTVATTRLAALLHDLGQALLPETVLQKRGRLDAEESALVREHPRLGARLVQEVATAHGLAEVILHHHERFDGRGYPAGLTGAAIPLAAQIVGVVEAYQAMTSQRPFRDAYSQQEAEARLTASAGGQFNPAVVEAFLAARQKVAEARAERCRAATAQALLASGQVARPLGSRLGATSR